jgi:hypothetical protein
MLDKIPYSPYSYDKQIDGYIWLEDGSWLESIGGGDGGCWWHHCVLPEVPDDCK